MAGEEHAPDQLRTSTGAALPQGVCPRAQQQDNRDHQHHPRSASCRRGQRESAPHAGRSLYPVTTRREHPAGHRFLSSGGDRLGGGTASARNDPARGRLVFAVPCASLGEGTRDIALLNVITSDNVTLPVCYRRCARTAKVIDVGSSEDDQSELVACAEAGVAGYHLRTEWLDDLHILTSKVFYGESACPPGFSQSCSVGCRRSQRSASRKRRNEISWRMRSRSCECWRWPVESRHLRPAVSRCIRPRTMCTACWASLGGTRGQVAAVLEHISIRRLEREGSRHGSGPKMALTVHIRPGGAGLIVDPCDVS
jgi:hypothetical protein